VAALEAWIDTHPGEEIPRAIGMHEFTLERGMAAEASGERAIFPFDQWMLQRPWDCYQQLDAGARHSVDELLDPVGLQSSLQRPFKHRLARRDFKLVVADPV
jgi:hypothetical protein